jgi:hypothetical protein
LLIGPLGVILDSCLGSRCKCQTVDSWFKIEKCSLDIRNHVPGSTVYETVGDSGKLKQANFTAFVNLQYSYYSKLKTTEPGFSFTPTAQACDCAYPGYLGSKEKIKSIYITTANDFNKTYYAGDTLNPAVTLGGKSIPDFVADWNKAAETGNVSYRWELVFTEAPDAEQWHQLRIEIAYGTGVFNANSVIFRLNP